jgi:hypothetical protein
MPSTSLGSQNAGRHGQACGSLADRHVDGCEAPGNSTWGAGAGVGVQYLRNPSRLCRGPPKFDFYDGRHFRTP